ncbi:hypothetical protein JKF63_01240 [Porcisia hertigi]|uniref:PX domain-containing protein n=1 Tax=Porcisia hertigi TaxID=2761500 RepID=A0A836HG47_9TRYP|nr:hypothetical protein JKF63_01240 [Porcisia hertigi]
MAAVNSISVKVDVPSLVKGHGALEMSYYIYPITLRLPGFMSDAQFSRRYSDFEALRSQLCASFWYCIVPPIPEKESVQDKLGKLPRMVTSAKETTTSEGDLLEYRRISLRRFLQRLAYHPVLGKSDLLQKFTNDTEWRQCTRDPVRPPRFMASSSLEEIARSWVPSSSTSGTGAQGRGIGDRMSGSASQTGSAYQLALTHEPVDDATWRATGEYVGELESNLKNMRNVLEALVDRHRRAAAAVSNFATSFGLLAEGEEDAELRSAIEGVRNCGRKVADVYSKHADDESTCLVSTLSFYVGMCAAVRETLNNMFSARQYLRNLQKKGQDLQASVMHGKPGSQAQMQGELNFVNEQRANLEEDLVDAERTFRKEFISFHDNKQIDAKDMLKKFGTLELSFSKSMQQEWDALRPLMESLTT